VGHNETSPDRGADVDDAPYTEDLDLAVSTNEELVALLRIVHLRADKPSLRALEVRTRHEASPLSKTAVSEMLRGTRFPRKAVMIGFLRACGVPDEQLEPWLRAWERVAAREQDDPEALRAHPGPKEQTRGVAERRWIGEEVRGQGTHKSPETASVAHLVWDEMHGKFGELCEAIERALASSGDNTADTSLAFDSYEIRPGMVSFSVIHRATHQRVFLRIDSKKCLHEADMKRFAEAVGLAQEISSHTNVAQILGGDRTGSGYPFVMQVIDSHAIPCSPPLHALRIIDIGRVLADALDYAHNMGGSFGIIQPSHIFVEAGDSGKPVLCFPHLPVFISLGGTATAEARDVYSFCAALLSMLSRPGDTPEWTESDSGALESQVRELLEFGVQEELHLRPSAAVLRDKFYELARGARNTWASAEVSRRISIPAKDGSPAAEILIKTGDLFGEPSDIVVSFSDTFDTDTQVFESGRVVISSSSLQGQLVDRMYDGDSRALDRDLRSALASTQVKSLESRRKKPLGKLKRYEIGVIAVLEHPERRIFAVAVSRMGNNLIARSSYQFLEKSLENLWEEIRKRGCDSVAMPIIGSGLARTGVSSYNLYDLITSSFRAHTQMRPICPQLRIIIHPSDRETIREIDLALSAQRFQT
jgi:Domain of unknown function (DUF6430)